MFLNFMMEPSIRPHAGDDLTLIFPEEALLVGSKLKGCWERMMMEYSAYPYFVTKDMMVIKKSVRVNRLDSSNVFRCVLVNLNLPGISDYNHSRPWVYKQRIDGTVAADVCYCIDDGRPTAPTAWEGWCASRIFCFTLGHFSLQDARRKRTETIQQPGE